jgi:AraC-like DNA-binding protein
LKNFGVLRIATFERGVRDVGAFNSIDIDVDAREPGIWLLWAAEATTVDCETGSIYLLKQEMLVLQAGELSKKSLSAFNGRVAYVPKASLGLADRLVESAAGYSLQASPGWAGILSAYLESLNLAALQVADASPVGRTLVEHHLLSLLRQMLSTLGQPVLAWGSGRRSIVDRAELWNTLQAWLCEHYSDTTVSAQRVADQFSISARYVHKLFAEYGNGQSFLGQLQELRLNKAKELLQNLFYSNLSVAEIGWFCGYADPVYFGKAFRKSVGMSPGEFRKLRKKIQSELT